MNLKGSSFIAKDTTGLTVTGNIKAESAVNSYENESKSTSKGFMSSKSSSFGISAGINSPILDRAKQAGNAVKQVKDGDTAGGMIEVVNAITGTVQGMSGNITKINGSRATMKDIENGDFKVNNSFYIGGNLRASFNKSKSSSDSHTESAVVTTMKPSNDNATITYNNVNNVTYQGTQAQGGTFIYNNVANIQKEAVELKNSYSSKNSSLGMGLSAGIGSKGSIKSNGISGNVSQSNGNLNTEGTNYQNGNFVNVNEVHNNTGSMTLTGFNQEGGKVTGNIEKLVVESKQNTSITTGSSRNVGVGFSGNGIPNSLNVSQNNTNGNKNYVENQSSFTVGQGSNLQVGTLENTASIIGKQSENATFKVNNYIGKNLENEDTMTTTGGSVGASLGQNPKITSVGFNQDSKEKEGITRNTVVGNVEIGQVSGDEINRDLSKANETTKDVHKTTNINIEPQLIEYTSNPTKFKEDLEVAVLEGKATGETVLKSIENVVNGGKEDIGDPERRSLNEIKEAVIRVKTAPEMNLIATGDLNSQEVLDTLKINGIEKFNPDDPDLPENVRARLDEVRKSGGEIEAFYDKTTNKIFINENVEDGETRALVAREWKISEDLKDGKGKANDEGQLKATVAGELAYDDMMKRGKESRTEDIKVSELKSGVMRENSEVTSDKINLLKETGKFLSNPFGYTKSLVEQGSNHAAHKWTVAKNNVKKVYNNVAGFITGENKNVTRSKNAELDDDNKRSENERNKRDKRSQNNFIAETKNKASKKRATKKSPPKGKKTSVHKTKKEQEKEFIEHMNSITRGYYENEPKYSKSADKVGTLAFIVANQNIKIGDGSSKVSDEVFAKAASSTIGQVVATGNFKMVPTKDKEYENNNKGVQKQVKAAKIEAQRKTRNSKDKDYYVRVDGKNKTVTVEETKRPKGYGSYLYKSLVLDPIESFHNFHEAKKAAFHGNIGGAFKNTLKGIGNLTSPFTLGVGSWAGDNYARFKPEEVQYGTREEVLKRKQTENLLVSTPIDMTIGFATSKIPVKKIISSKFKNPVTRTTTTESGATRKGATVLEEEPESIGNINNRTHSSLNNLHRSTGEKSYTLNSEKSNWKFKPEIPRTAVKNSEGNYTFNYTNSSVVYDASEKVYRYAPQPSNWNIGVAKSITSTGNTYSYVPQVPGLSEPLRTGIIPLTTPESYKATEQITNTVRNTFGDETKGKSLFEDGNFTSKYNDFYGYEYNAYTNPGPLAELNDHPHLNFYGGRYNRRVLTEDTIYYRAGDADNKYGRYFVETPPKSVIQVRMDTAVKPYWTNKRTGMWEKNDLGIDISGKSKIEKIYAVRVPAGTVIYEGPVAPQGGMYLGGMETNQIFLPDTRLPGIEFFEYVK